MKKIIALFTCCAAVAFFTSCQKEVSIENFPLGPDSTATDTSSRVKTYTETLQSSGNTTTFTFNLAYDNAGKLLSMISQTNPGDKFIYSYPAADKYTMDIYNSNAVSIHVDFLVNSSLFIDSTFQYNDTQDTSSEKYFYDPTNQLIKIYKYEITDGTPGLPGITTFTYNAEGDMVSSTDASGEVTTATYYTDLSYSAPVFPGYPNSFTAKKAHLKKTATITSGGTVTESATYTYTFDSRNRISKEIATASDGSIFTKAYSYQ